jgi:hypothetical protein
VCRCMPSRTPGWVCIAFGAMIHLRLSPRYLQDGGRPLRGGEVPRRVVSCCDVRMKEVYSAARMGEYRGGNQRQCQA